MADWILPFAIAAVVVVITFLVGSRLFNSNIKHQPATTDSFNETSNPQPVPAPDTAPLVAKPSSRSSTTYVAVGGMTLILAVAGVVVWLLKPRSLDCASTEARDLVSQIARENQALIDEIVRLFITENPPPKPPQAPKSPDRIAADQRIAALKDALAEANKNVAQANKEWLDRLRLSSGPQGLSTVQGRTEATQHANQARLELARAQASYDLAYGATDAAARTAIDKANAANLAAVFGNVQREMTYTLDDIRTTDKNLAGALTCAATLKGNAGKYSGTVPITYKLQQTSDGKLYAAVYGLKKS